LKTQRSPELTLWTGRDEIDGNGQQDNWFDRHVTVQKYWMPQDSR